MVNSSLKPLMSASRLDWETPASVFAPLHAEFGFTVDGCAEAHNAKLPRYFSPEVDGLNQDWSTERVWLNPPYGKVIRQWALKARSAALAVALVPARTDTRWWHEHVQGVATEVRFLRGRLKFVGALWPAPFPSVIIVWKAEK